MRSIVFRTWTRDSRGKILVILFLLWVLTLLGNYRFVFVTHTVVAVFATLFFDGVSNTIRKAPVPVTLSTWVTGMIIALVSDPTAGMFLPIVASFFAVTSKQLVGRGPHRHVFNPAAFGVVVSSLLLKRPVSWWAASWGTLPTLVVLFGMTPTLFRLRLLWMPLSFLVLYFFTMLQYGLPTAIRLLTDGTVVFFAFIMLPEPVTALSRGWWRWGWGILVGASVLVQSIFGFSVTDPLLLALLLANATTYLTVRRT